MPPIKSKTSSANLAAKASLSPARGAPGAVKPATPAKKTPAKTPVLTASQAQTIKGPEILNGPNDNFAKAMAKGDAPRAEGGKASYDDAKKAFLERANPNTRVTIDIPAVEGVGSVIKKTVSVFNLLALRAMHDPVTNKELLKLFRGEKDPVPADVKNVPTSKTKLDQPPIDKEFVEDLKHDPVTGERLYAPTAAHLLAAHGDVELIDAFFPESLRVGGKSSIFDFVSLQPSAKKGKEKEDQGESPLHFAIQASKLKMVEHLIVKRGAYINQRRPKRFGTDLGGYTPLDEAATTLRALAKDAMSGAKVEDVVNQATEILTFLLSKEADSNREDKAGLGGKLVSTQISEAMADVAKTNWKTKDALLGKLAKAKKDAEDQSKKRNDKRRAGGAEGRPVEGAAAKRAEVKRPAAKPVAGKGKEGKKNALAVAATPEDSVYAATIAETNFNSPARAQVEIAAVGPSDEEKKIIDRIIEEHAGLDMDLNLDFGTLLKGGSSDSAIDSLFDNRELLNGAQNTNYNKLRPGVNQAQVEALFADLEMLKILLRKANLEGVRVNVVSETREARLLSILDIVGLGYDKVVEAKESRDGARKDGSEEPWFSYIVAREGLEGRFGSSKKVAMNVVSEGDTVSYSIVDAAGAQELEDEFAQDQDSNRNNFVFGRLPKFKSQESGALESEDFGMNASRWKQYGKAFQEFFEARMTEKEREEREEQEAQERELAERQARELEEEQEGARQAAATAAENAAKVVAVVASTAVPAPKKPEIPAGHTALKGESFKVAKVTNVPNCDTVQRAAQAYLMLGVIPSRTVEDYRTILNEQLRSGDVPLVVKAIADSSGGNTILHDAVSQSGADAGEGFHLKLLEALLPILSEKLSAEAEDYAILLNARNDAGLTALELAIDKGRFELAAGLLYVKEGDPAKKEGAASEMDVSTFIEEMGIEGLAEQRPAEAGAAEEVRAPSVGLQNADHIPIAHRIVNKMIEYRKVRNQPKWEEAKALLARIINPARKKSAVDIVALDPKTQHSIIVEMTQYAVDGRTDKSGKKLEPDPEALADFLSIPGMSQIGKASIYQARMMLLPNGFAINEGKRDDGTVRVKKKKSGGDKKWAQVLDVFENLLRQLGVNETPDPTVLTPPVEAAAAFVPLAASTSASPPALTPEQLEEQENEAAAARYLNKEDKRPPNKRLQDAIKGKTPENIVKIFEAIAAKQNGNNPLHDAVAHEGAEPLSDMLVMLAGIGVGAGNRGIFGDTKELMQQVVGAPNGEGKTPFDLALARGEYKKAQDIFENTGVKIEGASGEMPAVHRVLDAKVNNEKQRGKKSVFTTVLGGVPFLEKSAGRASPEVYTAANADALKKLLRAITDPRAPNCVNIAALGEEDKTILVRAAEDAVAKGDPTLLDAILELDNIAKVGLSQIRQAQEEVAKIRPAQRAKHLAIGKGEDGRRGIDDKLMQKAVECLLEESLPLHTAIQKRGSTPDKAKEFAALLVALREKYADPEKFKEKLNAKTSHKSAFDIAVDAAQYEQATQLMRAGAKVANSPLDTPLVHRILNAEIANKRSAGYLPRDNCATPEALRGLVADLTNPSLPEGEGMDVAAGLPLSGAEGAAARSTAAAAEGAPPVDSEPESVLVRAAKAAVDLKDPEILRQVLKFPGIEKVGLPQIEKAQLILNPNPAVKLTKGNWRDAEKELQALKALKESVRSKASPAPEIVSAPAPKIAPVAVLARAPEPAPAPEATEPVVAEPNLQEKLLAALRGKNYTLANTLLEQSVPFDLSEVVAIATDTSLKNAVIKDVGSPEALEVVLRFIANDPVKVANLGAKKIEEAQEALSGHEDALLERKGDGMIYSRDNNDPWQKVKDLLRGMRSVIEGHRPSSKEPVVAAVRTKSQTAERLAALYHSALPEQKAGVLREILSGANAQKCAAVIGEIKQKNKGKTPLHDAAENNDEGLLKAVQELRLESLARPVVVPPIRRNTGFHAVPIRRDTGVSINYLDDPIKYLTELFDKEDAQGRTAFEVAIATGHPVIARQLFDAGAATRPADGAIPTAHSIVLRAIAKRKEELGGEQEPQEEAAADGGSRQSPISEQMINLLAAVTKEAEDGEETAPNIVPIADLDKEESVLTLLALDAAERDDPALLKQLLIEVPAVMNIEIDQIRRAEKIVKDRHRLHQNPLAAESETDDNLKDEAWQDVEDLLAGMLQRLEPLEPLLSPLRKKAREYFDADPQDRPEDILAAAEINDSNRDEFLAAMKEAAPEGSGTLLHHAALVADVKLLKLVLERYPQEIDALDGDNRTALEVAIANDHRLTASVLLKAGATTESVLQPIADLIAQRAIAMRDIERVLPAAEDEAEIPTPEPESIETLRLLGPFPEKTSIVDLHDGETPLSLIAADAIAKNDPTFLQELLEQVPDVVRVDADKMRKVQQNVDAEAAKDGPKKAKWQAVANKLKKMTLALPKAGPEASEEESAARTANWRSRLSAAVAATRNAFVRVAQGVASIRRGRNHSAEEAAAATAEDASPSLTAEAPSKSGGWLGRLRKTRVSPAPQERGSVEEVTEPLTLEEIVRRRKMVMAREIGEWPAEVAIPAALLSNEEEGTRSIILVEGAPGAAAEEQAGDAELSLDIIVRECTVPFYDLIKSSVLADLPPEEFVKLPEQSRGNELLKAFISAYEKMHRCATNEEDHTFNQEKFEQFWTGQATNSRGEIVNIDHDSTLNTIEKLALISFFDKQCFYDIAELINSAQCDIIAPGKKEEVTKAVIKAAISTEFMVGADQMFPQNFLKTGSPLAVVNWAEEKYLNPTQVEGLEFEKMKKDQAEQRAKERLAAPTTAPTTMGVITALHKAAEREAPPR